MYKPPDRIRHRLVPLRAPSAAEAAKSRLFSSIRLPSGLELCHRTWVPAMVPWRATQEGFVTPEVIGWYRRFALGRPGALVVEATGVRDVPSGPLLRIGHDRFIPGLRELASAVREASGGATRLFIQLIDFLRIRRRPEPRRFLREFLRVGPHHRRGLEALDDDPAWHHAPEEAIRARLVDDEAARAVLSPREREALDRGARERVDDLELAHVRELPQNLPPIFADAASRAREAGFDGVELHFAHAYTMASFLSALNEREDGYGTTREGRARLPREVLASVRERVGADYTVGCRMLCDEIVEGGSRVEDAAYFAERFAADGIDFISLSTGGKFEDAKQPKIGQAVYPYTGRSGWECMPPVISDEQGPFGRNIPKMAAIRAALRRAGRSTPVVICGGIHDFDQAEGYLAEGSGDVIAAARQSLADPDWFAKLRRGEGDTIRRCKFTNYCEALDQKHAQVTCQLWDRVGLDEPDVPLTKDGKRRLTAP